MNYAELTVSIYNDTDGLTTNEGATVKGAFGVGSLSSLSVGSKNYLSQSASISYYRAEATCDDGYEFVQWDCSYKDGSSTKKQTVMTNPMPKSSSAWNLSGVDWRKYQSVGNRLPMTLVLHIRSTGPRIKTIILHPGSGATVVPDTIRKEIVDGQVYGPLPTPVRDGYIFEGWYSQGGVEIDDGTPLDNDSPTDLYAHWREKPVGTFTISFDLNGGSGGPDTISVVEGESTTIPSDQIPTKDGATFIVWLYNGTDEYPPGSTITPTSDMVLVAKWKPTTPSKHDYLVFSGSGMIVFSVSSGMLQYG